MTPKPDWRSAMAKKRKWYDTILFPLVISAVGFALYLLLVSLVYWLN